MKIKRIKLLNTFIDCPNGQSIEKLIEGKRVIFTPNPEILLLCRANKAYRKAFNSADLFLPDGHGLQFTSTLLRFPKLLRFIFYFPALVLFLFNKSLFKSVIPELRHGSDFMADLIAHAAQNKLSVYFLGAGPGVAKKCSEVFLKKHPDLIVAGCSSDGANQASFNKLSEIGADIVFVAYGAPKQEFWISKFGSKLKGLKHIVGVGGSFDFWSGEIKRAPLFIRKLGLEWFWRLLLNPRARFLRIFNALVRYPLTSFFYEKKSF